MQDQTIQEVRRVAAQDLKQYAHEDGALFCSSFEAFGLLESEMASLERSIDISPGSAGRGSKIQSAALRLAALALLLSEQSLTLKR